jgi:hypothetical protein
MSILKNIFRMSQPVKPIFPGENFSILKLAMPDRLAFARFFDGFLKERIINFSFQKDPDWKAVSGFIK